MDPLQTTLQISCQKAAKRKLARPSAPKAAAAAADEPEEVSNADLRAEIVKHGQQMKKFSLKINEAETFMTSLCKINDARINFITDNETLLKKMAGDVAEIKDVLAALVDRVCKNDASSAAAANAPLPTLPPQPATMSNQELIDKEE